MAEELEQNSDNFEQQNSDDFADNYFLQGNWTMTDTAAYLPFSGATPHSLSEFRNAGLTNPFSMTGAIKLGDAQLKNPKSRQMDCRQDGQNSNSPDPLAGVFSSTSNTGPDIWYITGSNAVTQYANSMYLDFSAGTYSYAIANPSTSTTVSNYGFTMECWIRPDNFTSGNFNTNAVMMRGGNGLRGDIATLNTGKVRFRWTGADSGVQSSTTLSTGTWYHVVGIYHVYNYVAQGNAANSGIGAIFINGSLDNSASLSGYRVTNTPNGSTTLLSFGFYNSQNVSTLNPPPSPTYKFFYNGRIGQVRFYDGALPPAKVLQNYNATKGTYGYGSNSGNVYT